MFSETEFVVMIHLKQVHPLLHMHSNNTDQITSYCTPLNFITAHCQTIHFTYLDKCNEQTLVVAYIGVLKQGLLCSIIEMIS